MEKLGRNIVKRCKGLPLAVSTLGGILRGKMLREWENVSKDVSFYLPVGDAVCEDDEYFTVRRVLGLSYDCLASRLRHCFLYLGRYKEDELIDAEELYKYWVAEGLISVEDKAEGEMVLDVAERYLNELAERNLVQVEMADVGMSWSKYQSCRLHDLIRDLCLSKLKEENFLHVIDLRVDRNLEARRVRRLLVRSYGASNVHILTHVNISRIRSFCYPQSDGKAWPEKYLSLKKFKLLRVLRFKFSRLNLLSIGDLVYLKYLSFYMSTLTELPSSIGNLKYLEFLDLRIYNSSTRISNVLWKLNQLKHLYLPGHMDIHEKLRFEGLNELESLHNFDSEYCDAYDLVGLSKIKVFSGKLKDENNLAEEMVNFINSKELRYSNITVVGGLTCMVLLSQCFYIDHLTVSNRSSIRQKRIVLDRFSTRLVFLTLKLCGFQKDPMIVLEKLPNLRSLCMGQYVYTGREMVCSAMGFPQLQYLKISDFLDMRNLRVYETAMPKLSYLCIERRPKWEMLPDGLRFLNALTDLHLHSMPKSFTNRARVKNGVEGEDFDIIRHIRNV